LIPLARNSLNSGVISHQERGKLRAMKSAKADRYSNQTTKKIPNTVRSHCEWGHDDDSLKIENLPKIPVPPGQQEMDLP
jgi:hypothetical protein